MKLNTIEEIIADIRQGKMVILMDDEDRENEGDLIMAAEMVRPEDINFMAKHARGLICLPMSKERCEYLQLPLMVNANQAQYGTNFTVSIEAAEGVTTGISAADRAHTVRVAVGRHSRPEDIAMPGHIFPLMAKPGGVLSRAGHTEAGCDLARLAGFESAAVIVEIMNEDGTMARRPELEKFAEEHNLKIGTIADLIHYRAVTEQTVEKIDEHELPTDYGVFNLITYQDTIQGHIHLAMVKGEPKPDSPTLVRVHFANVLRDLLGAVREDSESWPIGKALAYVAEAGEGVVILLDSESGEEDIGQKVQDFFNPRRRKPVGENPGSTGYQTIGTGSQILRDLGVGKMRVLSAPMRFSALSGFDLEVVEYLPFNGEPVAVTHEE
ncbi:3,4-dihydroxy-2-butanone-4-phosphate synthase [Hahella sp. CCB-MM4]|uniref:bifunctional 3,4-dihydroxy-2-butanone-4-phosphate synthase/GTP cyclohydrolase II n=1 Tax=Hahella sp. (strain CCB-MM4) TaxID=1926491 RepID=UPI000B9A3F54|nr:bifunctional 3,4-dihydroxy-2-butanone-4-phosphate synthase/GTP cyclohydrolase II [Hahella sp. CCB-MM4]OZG71452.1 3,4-dihydroxy-2-butanone-4-phosphate synthase [Hahella sp. CCB-MM4]